MTAQTAADLRAAAEVLRRDGWTQAKLYDARSGCRCVMGGISKVVSPEGHQDLLRDDVRYLRFVRAEAQLRQVLGDLPVRFNDAPGRTADEVIAALEAAANAAEQQAQPQSGDRP